MSKPTIFISYSHKDEIWKDRLKSHLGVLEQENRISVWDDRKIDAGDTWYPEIEAAMQKAAVAVCLISADYLASNFVTKEEVPYLLERRRCDDMVILPVLLRPCFWEIVSWIEETQMLPRDGKSVLVDYGENYDVVFKEVSGTVIRIADDLEYTAPAPSPSHWSPPEKVDIDRMPVTGAELFGRKKELELLDESWESDNIHMVSLVAWGGVGKSTLVNRWLGKMALDNFRGAQKVFAWSFYSQGTDERVTSADQFIREALDWFGDPNPDEGSPWDKGRRLVERAQQEKTLLILDGLEPLQSPHEFEKGKIKDPALSMLIFGLARKNPGLCLITTREALPGMDRFKESVRQTDLNQISDEAGRALLRVSGVRGTDGDLEKATQQFGNHALALNLLGRYLYGIEGHHISHAGEIPDLDVSEQEGKHPRRVMEAFAHRFGKSPETDFLYMLGLFDRPAEKGAIDAVRGGDAVPGLTGQIHNIPEADWMLLLERLRKAGLIAPESRHRPDSLDCHPLVREHFGEKLRNTNPDAWKTGHSRLYEYYRDVAEKEFPDTLEEMEPLFAAVAHGCRADRPQETLDDVYWERIRRREKAYSVHNLGAFGADLAALSGFFEIPWNPPASGLTSNDKAFVLNEAGLCLRAVGRLQEAAQPMLTALEDWILQEEWIFSSIVAGNLTEVYLTIGQVAQAVNYARQSVEFTDRSEDAFARFSKRTTLADALNQAGEQAEAERLFREAETMQKEYQPKFYFLYSLQGFQFCDLLLDQGAYQEVQKRSGQAIEIAQRNHWLLDIALDNLSLGRAYLLQVKAEETSDFILVENFLNQAVEGLREYGEQNYLPFGLLARAALYRLKQEFIRAWDDLNEVREIAELGGMKLHLTDCHLEAARLHLAQGWAEKAGEEFEAAKALVEETGYHRRDREVQELQDLIAKG